MREFGDAHGRGGAAQGVFDDQFGLRLTEDQADAGLAAGVFQSAVDGRQVGVHRAGVFGFELASLEVDDDVAAQFEVVEEEVDPVVLAGTPKGILAAGKRKVGAEFKEELLDVLDQAVFDVFFAGILGQGEEIEVVRILKNLLDKIGLGSGQGSFEIGGGLALAVNQIAFDVKHEHVPAPAVFEGGLGIPEALRAIFYLVQNDAVVEPG